jgi:hypothetical protein
MVNGESTNPNLIDSMDKGQVSQMSNNRPVPGFGQKSYLTSPLYCRRVLYYATRRESSRSNSHIDPSKKSLETINRTGIGF